MVHFHSAIDSWVWVTGENWNYTSWSPGIPNVSAEEPDFAWSIETRAHFWGLQSLKGSYWNDYPENGYLVTGWPNVTGYIVEWDVTSVPEPSSVLTFISGLVSFGFLSRRIQLKVGGSKE